MSYTLFELSTKSREELEAIAAEYALSNVKKLDNENLAYAILDAQKEEFFPEMCRLLEILKDQGQVYYSQPMLPEILWDAYSAVYRRLMQEAIAIRNGRQVLAVGDELVV